MDKSQKIEFTSPEAFAASFENLKNMYFSHKVCEAKDYISACTGSIIRAHSVSRKFLKMIADGKGQVYHFDDRISRRIGDRHRHFMAVLLQGAAMRRCFQGRSD